VKKQAAASKAKEVGGYMGLRVDAEHIPTGPNNKLFDEVFFKFG
jgi:hypothetical protein